MAIQQYRSDLPVYFNVYKDCIKGTCTCIHYIGDCRSQLLPCQTFVELFLHEDSDPDWQYILSRVMFGFRITNPDCNITYSTKPQKIKSELLRDIIEKKLRNEINDGKISIVDNTHLCTHGVFCVPKEGGGQSYCRL